MNAFLATIRPLGDLAGEIFIGDIVDVVIIAILIYSALILFKQTRSLLIVTGLGIVVVFYVLAQVFNLYLTSLVLQSFFSIFLLVLVIIFQEELRRFFEFIAAFGTRQTKSGKLSTTSGAIRELMTAISYLASQKVGALIILRGNENIDRHLEGGRILDGIISEDLIASIFDTTSPGHDGAMIIHKNRISMFGAHLPLSHNFSEIGRLGTRHSAALGISELSDAFAIVISEERGTISIASQGKLEYMKDMKELDDRLNFFLKSISSEYETGFWRKLILKNSIEKVLAVISASLIWFFVAYGAGTVQRDFIVPISFGNVPANIIIEETRPISLTVTLEGRGKSAFDRLDEKTLEIRVNANELKAGSNTVKIESAMISRPTQFSVIKIDPQTVKIVAVKFVMSTVPVEPEIEGAPAQGFIIENISYSPNTVSILVPEGSQTPARILTEPVVVDGIRENKTITAKLVLPKTFRLQEKTSADVLVNVTVRKK